MTEAAARARTSPHISIILGTGNIRSGAIQGTPLGSKSLISFAPPGTWSRTCFIDIREATVAETAAEAVLCIQSLIVQFWQYCQAKRRETIERLHAIVHDTVFRSHMGVQFNQVVPGPMGSMTTTQSITEKKMIEDFTRDCGSILATDKPRPPEPPSWDASHQGDWRRICDETLMILDEKEEEGSNEPWESDDVVMIYVREWRSQVRSLRELNEIKERNFILEHIRRIWLLSDASKELGYDWAVQTQRPTDSNDGPWIPETDGPDETDRARKVRRVINDALWDLGYRWPAQTQRPTDSNNGPWIPHRPGLLGQTGQTSQTEPEKSDAGVTVDSQQRN